MPALSSQLSRLPYTPLSLAPWLLIGALATACSPGKEPAGTAQVAAEQPQIAAFNPDEPDSGDIPCELQMVEEGISALHLISLDGRCRVFLPLDPQPGSYEIRVSAAGESNVAALEAQTSEGTLYATEGTLVLEHADEQRLRGHVDAQDTVPPLTGSIRADFNIARTP